MAIPKFLKDIREEDLLALITKPEPEGKTIEYKEVLPPDAPASEIIKFLKQISSFANAIGGDLIFGIYADNGIPKELRGLQIDSLDNAIQRLRHIISNGLAPTLRGVDLQEVELPSKPGRWAIIVRIQKSWAAPHMVTFQDHGKFYIREERNKRLMKIDELRAAFLGADTAIERTRNFRSERLAQIRTGDTPALLDETAPKLVLHIIPLNAFNPASQYNLTPLFDYNDYNTRSLIEPLMLWEGSAGPAPRRNFDGLLIHRPLEKGITTSYTQFFRNGIIEAVDTSILNASHWHISQGLIREPRFSGIFLDQRLLTTSSRYLKVQELLGVELPVFVMISLLGVKGYRITIPEDRGFNLPDQIDRPDLIVPETLIDTFESDVAQAMKSILDTIWNAGGWERSMSYDEAGKLKGL